MSTNIGVLFIFFSGSLVESRRGRKKEDGEGPMKASHGLECNPLNWPMCKSEHHFTLHELSIHCHSSVSMKLITDLKMSFLDLNQEISFTPIPITQSPFSIDGASCHGPLVLLAIIPMIVEANFTRSGGIDLKRSKHAFK
ncbi:hypothetical protein BLOT_013594 [Blomia tropicalis]|nr:hypothetical protein BLOT_013594 [Blomia tropicalis]